MNIPGLQSLLSTRLGFRAYMALRWGNRTRPSPNVRPVNTTLKTQGDVDDAVNEARRLDLPPFSDPPKTWDTLGALHEVLTHTNRDALVLDAGAEMYSRILPWLYLYGYRRLYGNNLVFDRTMTNTRGHIAYEYGDITATRFPDAHFDAITCLSVVEHGVDLDKYFREMARILSKPGAILVTSTDYFDVPTDTRGLQAYGTPIRVFTKAEMLAAFDGAARYGLDLSGPVDLGTRDRVVTWKQFGLSYSFIVFSMVRRRR